MRVESSPHLSRRMGVPPVTPPLRVSREGQPATATRCHIITPSLHHSITPILLLTLLTLPLTAQESRAPYYLIDNCTQPLPSSETIQSTIETTDVKVGASACRLTYDIDQDGGKRTAQIVIPQETLFIKSDGKLKLFLKGDGSQNMLELRGQYGDMKERSDGYRYLEGAKAITFPSVIIEGTDWKQIELPVTGLPRDKIAYLTNLYIHKSGRKDPAPQTQGTLVIDDLRLYPDGGNAPTIANIQLSGPFIRRYSPLINVNVDVRHFGNEPVRVEGNLTIVDRHENLVMQRQFETTVGAGEAKELNLSLMPENFHLFLPPFKVTGEVFSNEMPQLSGSLNVHLVMGNSFILFDDFGNLHGRWFCSGAPHYGNNSHQVFGEEQRAHAAPQTQLKISRVDLPEAHPKDEGKPPGRFAMQVDYDGISTVYTGEHRQLPGDAYELGLWVNGDESGAELFAILHDNIRQGADYYLWRERKSSFAEKKLCTIDFKGWRYVTTPLPGNGIGAHTPNGSTIEIDYPLTLSGFTIKPPKEKPAGSLKLSAIYVATQQPNAESLAVTLAYDDPNHFYSPDKGASFTVQNGWTVEKREIAANWTLLDRTEQVVVRGREAFILEPIEQKTFRIELKPHAAKIAESSGPFRLLVLANDSSSAGSAEAQIILARPDSEALIADFESEKNFPGLNALGVTGAPPQGQPAASTSTSQKKSGGRSLALEWQKARAVSLVSVDPPLPGYPVELSMWVYGDASGVYFYPVIGDQLGINSGNKSCQWDLFLSRTMAGPLPYAVKVDWNGWRELKFLLPVLPASWKETESIRAFAPTYPLGLHLVVAPPKDVPADKGTLYIDDVRVKTHLLPEERIAARLERKSESNFLSEGTALRVFLSNYEMQSSQTGKRSVALSGGLFDWRGQRVAGVEKKLDLNPGVSQPVDLVASTPGGAYVFSAEVREGDNVLLTLKEDLIIADVAKLLGADWQGVLKDPSKLRVPLNDRFTLVEHDWDWAEFQPGNLQVQTILKCAQEARVREQDPWMLLGYSTFWAASTGFDSMLEDRLPNRNGYGPGGRDWGHATDIFQIPRRLDDWENYVLEMMRLAGRDVKGWILWNTPDSNNSLGVPPGKFADMIRLADKWRQRYCPDTPIILGGMSRDTAIPYLADLAKEDALQHISGVNLRVDAGVTSPEDGRLVEYIEELARASASNGKSRILLTDLDWAVEREGSGGLDAFDQAVYLSRATFLLDRLGIHPTLVLQNEDDSRLGFGMTYKKSFSIPPLKEKLPTYQLKPVWWAMVRTKKLLAEAEVVTGLEVQDVFPGRTRCMLYRRKTDKKLLAVAWRNNDPGWISFQRTGATTAKAEDIMGASISARDGWYPIGKAPVVIELTTPKELQDLALDLIMVRETPEKSAWPQEVLASFSPASGRRYNYASEGDKTEQFQGRDSFGDYQHPSGISFRAEGKANKEAFEIQLPSPSGLVLRKNFYLDETGQEAEVSVNGNPVGTWNLKPSAKELSKGFRISAFVIPVETLKGAKTAKVEVRYKGQANTIAWTALAYDGSSMPLSAFGAIHSDSTVASARLARNVVGLPTGIGKETYKNGIGVFAPSLLEYSLNGQFRRFTATAGIDRVTKGKGSVVFEIYLDGEKKWTSSVMTGLDEPAKIDLDVTGAKRLRLIVNDGGDGNRFDAADWCDAELHVR
ncbi:MAG: NPCBM/NEW2 domain-containing protein [Planctomycetota bacterium]|nr:NPCBM/NEW2 domain-containing protein [Planctomycetota bacterium]